MIITCPSCNKKFEIDTALIPKDGRTLQCGSCDHQWFFKNVAKKKEKILKNFEYDIPQKTEQLIIEAEKTIFKNFDQQVASKNIVNNKKKETALVKYQKKTKFKFSNLFGYLIVFIISFVALIIILDTFKYPLSVFFPNIEEILYNLYETIKDIISFSRDLIK